LRALPSNPTRITAGDHVARLGPLDDAQDVSRNGRHDALVLIGIAVAVVNVGHRAGAVIGHAVHRVAAEAKPGDPRQAGAPQVVRRDALDPKLADELLQQSAQLVAAQKLSCQSLLE